MLSRDMIPAGARAGNAYQSRCAAAFATYGEAMNAASRTFADDARAGIACGLWLEALAQWADLARRLLAWQMPAFQLLDGAGVGGPAFRTPPAWRADDASTALARLPAGLPAERWSVAVVTAGWELCLELNRALVEMALIRLDEAAELMGASAADGKPVTLEALPREVLQALVHTETGGLPDAAVRVALILKRLGGVWRDLPSPEEVSAAVGPEAGLAGLSDGEMRGLLRRQAHIVDHSLERALNTLPRLVAFRVERERLCAVVDRLSQSLPDEPELSAFASELKRWLRAVEMERRSAVVVPIEAYRTRPT